jgi:hypothetical protein
MEPPRRPSQASSSGRRSDTGQKSDKLTPRQKLEMHRMYCERNDKYPPALADHVIWLEQHRSAPSPNAKLIARKANMIKSAAEQDGIDEMRRLLLYAGATDGGEDFVRVVANTNLNSAFLPASPEVLKELLPGLERPQPDTAVGYMTCTWASRGDVSAPFTLEQEEMIRLRTLTPEIHFPWFTAQWKSPAKGQTHEQALDQGIRDGATVVKYLHDFFKRAYPGREPTVVETCHYSATIDMRSILLFIHWWDAEGYHMEKINSGILDKERDAIEIRAILRNMQDYALRERLDNIRLALNQLLKLHLQQAPVSSAVPLTPSSVLSCSGVSMSIPDALPIDDPARPTKRMRVHYDQA